MAPMVEGAKHEKRLLDFLLSQAGGGDPLYGNVPISEAFDQLTAIQIRIAATRYEGFVRDLGPLINEYSDCGCKQPDFHELLGDVNPDFKASEVMDRGLPRGPYR